MWLSFVFGFTATAPVAYNAIYRQFCCLVITNAAQRQEQWLGCIHYY